MNPKQWLLSAVFIVLAWWVVPTAHAVIVTGTFAGTLENVYASEAPQLAFDGDRFTGTFGFDTEAVRSADGMWWSDDPRVAITVDVPGERISYNWPYYADPLSGFSAGGAGESPYLWLTAGWGHWSIDLLLAGAGAPFTTDGRLATFRPGPVDAANSALHIQSGLFYWSADGRLTDVRFDPVAAPVPEPGVWLGLLLGLGVLLARTVRHKPPQLAGA